MRILRDVLVARSLAALLLAGIATFALLALGLAGLGFSRRKQA